MALRLIYQMFAKLMSWMVLRARSENAKEIEILVLRHQLAVLQRHTHRPRISRIDRAVIAALGRLLPADRRRGFLVHQARSCAGTADSSAATGRPGPSRQAAPLYPQASAP